MGPRTTARVHFEFSPRPCQRGLHRERKQRKKITKIKETMERADQLGGLQSQRWSRPIELPLVSFSDKTEHITPIAARRAVLRRALYNVNTAEIRPCSSRGVSSDPEQKDLFSTRLCQQASESRATPSGPRVSVSLTLSPPPREPRGG